MRWLLCVLILMPVSGQPRTETSRREIFETYIQPQLRTVARTVCACGDCLTGAECERFQRACQAAVEQGRCPSFPRGNGKCDPNRASRCRTLVGQAMRAETDPETIAGAPAPQPAQPSAVGDAGEPRKTADWSGAVGSVLNRQFESLYASKDAATRRRLAGQTASVEFTAYFQAGEFQRVEVGSVSGGSPEFQQLARQAVEMLAGKKAETPKLADRAVERVPVVWKFSSR